MSDTKRVRIGLHGARELEFEVDDPAALQESARDAIRGDEPMIWVTDKRGHTFGIVTSKLAFLEVEGEASASGVGFGS